MKVIIHLYNRCEQLISLGMPMSLLREQPIFDRIISIKYDVANDELHKFADYDEEIENFYNKLMDSNA